MLIGNHFVHHYVVRLGRYCIKALKRKAEPYLIARALGKKAVVVATPAPQAMPRGRKCHARHHRHIYRTVIERRLWLLYAKASTTGRLIGQKLRHKHRLATHHRQKNALAACHLAQKGVRVHLVVQRMKKQHRACRLEVCIPLQSRQGLLRQTGQTLGMLLHKLLHKRPTLGFGHHCLRATCFSIEANISLKRSTFDFVIATRPERINCNTPMLWLSSSKSFWVSS